METKQLALFKSLKYDFTHAVQAESSIITNPDYIRVSQWTQVEFTPLAQADVTTEIISNLLLEIASTELAHKTEIDKLNERLKEYQALPAPQQAA